MTDDHLRLTDDAIANLKQGTARPLHQNIAAAEIELLRDEVATDPEERSELHWTRGYRTAMTGILENAMSALGYDDELVKSVKWATERERTIAALRVICAKYGDNDWPDNLHLADVIEKHLHRNLNHADESKDE